MDNSDTGEYLIKKEIIHPGKTFIPFVDGTRVNWKFEANSQLQITIFLFQG